MTTQRAGYRVPRWALPNELAVFDGGRPGRRTARDWVVDGALFSFAALLWLFYWRETVVAPDEAYAAVVPAWIRAVDPWVGVAACLALWWRRRFPLRLAVAMVPALATAATATGAALVMILTVAIHRSWLPAILITTVQAAQGVAFALVYHPPGVSAQTFASNVALIFVIPLAWGMAVRARRQVLLGLRRDGEQQRRAHARRVAQARTAERARIAREMHDVLAHRISLLSVHAGALAYRTSQAESGQAAPLRPAELNEAVEVIRDSAHQALDELGEVLAVLRADEPEAAVERRPPQPLLSDLPQLVDEARAAGQRVSLEVAQPLAQAPPRPQEQRTVYRVVQEGLTNARKHAPQAPVTVRVSGAPRGPLLVSVTNPLPAGAVDGAIPGAGAGLAGLAERVGLEGGSLEYGPHGGSFRLSATLPWQG